MSSVCGLAGTIAWYILAYKPTSAGITGLFAPGVIGAIHPILPGTVASFLAFALFAKKGTFRVTGLARPAEAAKSEAVD
jgi:hypothetical protein